MQSAEVIGWAIGGIEREILSTRDRLAALTRQAQTLRSKLPAGVRDAVARATAGLEAAAAEAEGGTTRKRKRRKMSPEARKRISEMMKKRWAERRKGK